MVWMLVICVGVTWAGCGGVMRGEYPNEESCYRALRTMVMPESGVVADVNSKRRSGIAYCRPKDQP